MTIESDILKLRSDVNLLLGMLPSRNSVTDIGRIVDDFQRNTGLTLDAYLQRIVNLERKLALPPGTPSNDIIDLCRIVDSFQKNTGLVLNAYLQRIINLERKLSLFLDDDESMANHMSDTSNPHQTTSQQVDAIPDAADSIKDTHIDWGIGSGQVSATDVPNDSSVIGTTVSGALETLASDVIAEAAARSADDIVLQSEVDDINDDRIVSYKGRGVGWFHFSGNPTTGDKISIAQADGEPMITVGFDFGAGVDIDVVIGGTLAETMTTLKDAINDYYEVGETNFFDAGATIDGGTGYILTLLRRRAKGYVETTQFTINIDSGGIITTIGGEEGDRDLTPINIFLIEKWIFAADVTLLATGAKLPLGCAGVRSGINWSPTFIRSVLALDSSGVRKATPNCNFTVGIGAKASNECQKTVFVADSLADLADGDKIQIECLDYYSGIVV